jgi:hypothetical protein
MKSGRNRKETENRAYAYLYLYFSVYNNFVWDNIGMFIVALREPASFIETAGFSSMLI